jgi:hypothetical protein
LKIYRGSAEIDEKRGKNKRKEKKRKEKVASGKLKFFWLQEPHKNG